MRKVVWYIATLFVVAILLLIVWRLTWPLTPENYTLGAQIQTAISDAYKTGNIDTAIASLEEQSVIKPSSPSQVNMNRVLIVNPNPDTPPGEFVAIWHIDLWHSRDKGAAVLTNEGYLKTEINWKKLIKSDMDLKFYKIILK
ncbi:hypothetical protein STSP2_00991 [Anaerohalosphaera lusitana]|uniref:Uncharacterized protein n=1 Tax=Anaerohalosphaera lusitana TaxID=1936003 RepID=A0A1U9NJS9_9BACT|nr:hypothetical protein [Anaerohalosphaera lusitana]AQT67840.1 hypothetical protein STSP2_00991 [Anaerohalosphaera lusitana]